MLLIFASSCAAQQGFTNISEKNGNIGIGTNEPDEKLTVKGKIHTQEVLVDLNGAVAPDYVFESYFNGYSTLHSSYKMLDLKSLENYLKQHLHLPEIPSAAAIEKEGLALKKMQLLLLQKIEELTLYTIEQQQQIDELKEQLNSLSKE